MEGTIMINDNDETYDEGKERREGITVNEKIKTRKSYNNLCRGDGRGAAQGFRHSLLLRDAFPFRRLTLFYWSRGVLLVWPSRCTLHTHIDTHTPIPH